MEQKTKPRTKKAKKEHNGTRPKFDKSRGSACFLQILIHTLEKCVFRKPLLTNKVITHLTISSGFSDPLRTPGSFQISVHRQLNTIQIVLNFFYTNKDHFDYSSHTHPSLFPRTDHQIHIIS